jgi:hypothetical protein
MLFAPELHRSADLILEAIHGMVYSEAPRKDVLSQKDVLLRRWTARDPEPGAFREVALPGISVIRVMDQAVHQAALERAGEKLVELERRAGKDAL